MSTTSDLRKEQRLVVFWADASPTLGAGHIRRCLVLAQALEAENWRTGFLVGPQALETVPELDRTGRVVVTMPANASIDDVRDTLAERWPGGADVLVVDRYDIGRAEETAQRSWSRRILVIDDLADRDRDCDILLDQTLGRLEGAYAHRVPAQCRLLLGTDYALLRPSFSRLRMAGHPRDMSEPVKHLLVAMGATDPSDATTFALRAIAESGIEAEVEILLGTGAPHLQTIRTLLGELPFVCRLHVEPADPDAIVAGCDLAIGAPGTSAWERACLGLPSILVLTAENQRANAAALHAAGAAQFVGTAADLAIEDLAREITRLTNDPAARSEMSRTASRICDGLGAQRTAAELDPPVARDGAPVRLRRAARDDGETMFIWQCDPGARRFSRNPEAPSRERHFSWLDAKLADPGCLLHIVTHGDEPAGILRLDRIEGSPAKNGALEISILVATDRLRRGIGSAALALARRLVPSCEIRAYVLPENQASADLFAGAGYRPDGGGWYVNSATAIPERIS